MSPFLLLLTLTVFPGNAWAVQTHGAPEGLYVHQLAHVFLRCCNALSLSSFFTSLCYGRHLSLTLPYLVSYVLLLRIGFKIKNEFFRRI